MSKGFTPIIGLAVVVALALAAVFGAMSIANPAQADSEVTLDVYVGHQESIDLADHLTGKGIAAYVFNQKSGEANAANINAAFTVAIGSETNLDFTDGADIAGVVLTGDAHVTEAAFTGLVAGLPQLFISDSATYRFEVVAEDADDEKVDSVDLAITLKRSRAAARAQDADDKNIDIPDISMGYTETDLSVDLKPAYKDGTGRGMIVGYHVVSTNPASVDSNVSPIAKVKDDMTGGKTGSAALALNTDAQVGSDGMLTLEVQDIATAPSDPVVVTVLSPVPQSGRR